jgi:PKD repeat protein
MKTIKQTILGLALSVFSISAFAQCLTSVSVTVLSNTNNGNLTVSQVFNIPTSTVIPVYNSYALYGSNSYYGNSFSMGGSFTFNNIPSGTYSLCVSDSSNCSGWIYLNNCTTVVITNTVVTPCNAAFTQYTDSSCMTHFINSSTGSGLTYQWIEYPTGLVSTATNPILNLSNGNHTIILITLSGGSQCDSVMQTVNVNCAGGSTNTPCSASFSTYTDSACLTHFINTTPCTYSTSSWNINGTNYFTSSPVLNLVNGWYNVILNASITGSGVSTYADSIYVNCGGTWTVNPTCQVNSQFAIFGDSINPGNYFAYNMSSGNGSLSYLWNFGDGSTSIQQYPFHQYATPGNYIVCLTVTNTTGTLTCSDTDCDSSSVQKVSAAFLMSQLNILAPTSVKENLTTIKNINAFPNPMGDALMIEVELSALINNMSYTIVDALGKIVIKNEMTDSKTTINTSALDKGFYFLTISTNDGSSVKTIKLVK